MMFNQIKRAIEVEKVMAIGLRMHKYLFKNLQELGFWQSGGTCFGNEEHYFFTHRADENLTIDVTLIDRVVMDVSIMIR